MERQQTVSRAKSLLTSYFPQGCPTDYLTFDLETSSFSPVNDVVVEVGWCIVRDRKIVDCCSVVLNWYANPELIAPQWLTERMESAANSTAAKGGHYWFTAERLLAEGGPPLPILDKFMNMLGDAVLRREMLVTHNGSFDRRMLDGMAKRFDMPTVDWGAACLWDTGLFEKAIQNHQRAKWSLHEHCLKKYALVDKHQLDVSRAHRAAFDAQCTHHLFEAHRELLE